MTPKRSPTEVLVAYDDCKYVSERELAEALREALKPSLDLDSIKARLIRQIRERKQRDFDDTVKRAEIERKLK